MTVTATTSTQHDNGIHTDCDRTTCTWWQTGGQPAPERCDTVEQAVRLVGLDPNPDNLITAYALGAIDGYLAGLRRRFGFTTERDVAEHARFFGSQSWRFAPATLAVAIKAAERMTFPDAARDLAEGAGYHEFFAQQTEGMPDAVICGSCNRRLLLDVDDVWMCNRDGLPFCQIHACTGHAECTDESGC